MKRLWQSYACNNSSGSRLVARFDDPRRATAVGDELRQLLAELAGPNNSALEAIAMRYGIAWGDDGVYDGDDLSVTVDRDLVIVQLAYGLGVGPGVAAHLRQHGATLDDERYNSLHASVLFRAPIGMNPELDNELTSFARLLVRHPTGEVATMTAPWTHSATRRPFARGQIACFRDAGSAGLFFPIDARDLASLREWLAASAIELPIVAIEAYADRDLFRALAAARCAACGGPLDYLDPRLFDIETPQLVCKPCGGLYDLATFHS